MKNLIFLILPLLFVISCNEEKVDEELEPIDKDSIFGKWQLVEEWDGVMSDPYEVEDGYFYIFDSDSTFTTTQIGVCPDGTKGGFFELSSDSISNMLYMEWDCVHEEYDDFVPRLFNRYELEDGFLKLWPHEDVNTCYEGCWERFKKVAKEEK
ncbi:hypothetical protein [Marivirga sp.]|uniref:hypothetical protein n=1 Tax=Marivirga sp. TaxID=2018662 RepID=UPI003DA70F0B